MSSQSAPLGRIWLADHLLRDRLGHHFGYNLLLADAARSAGWDAVLVTHRDFLHDSVSGHRVERMFRNDWRASPPSFLSLSRTGLKILESLSAGRVAADLENVLNKEKFWPSDIILAQMLAPRHLECWLRWFARFDASLAPALVFHLGYDASRFGAHEGLHKALNRLRKRELDKRIYFISDSESLAAEYAKILKFDVRVLPHVVAADIEGPSTSNGNEPLHFVSLGNAREEKGFWDLAEAILMLDKDLLGKEIKFTIQCHQPDRKCMEAVERLVQRSLPRVHLIRENLGEKEYLSLLVSADVVLLPYHLDKYALRTSGVFCEALVAGKAVITTEGSWMSGEISRTGGGWLVPERNPAKLAGTIQTAHQEFASLSSGCRERVPGYKAHFSADTFIRGLMEIVNYATF